MCRITLECSKNISDAEARHRLWLAYKYILELDEEIDKQEKECNPGRLCEPATLCNPVKACEP